MDNILDINDICVYSNREIQDVYNESIVNIFMTETSYFKDIIYKRNSGILNESVLLEADESRLKKIKDTIKKFFKDLWEKIKGFFNRIKEKITNKSNKVVYDKIRSDMKLLEKSKYDEASDEIEKRFKEEKLFFIDFDLANDITKTSENSLNYYHNKMSEFYDKTKDIIKFIKDEDKNIKDNLRDHPEWNIVTHRDDSDYSTRGVHKNLTREKFEHLYDTVIKDLEEYIPKSYSMKKEEGTNIYIQKIKAYEKNNNDYINFVYAYSIAKKYLDRSSFDEEHRIKRLQKSYSIIEGILKNIQRELESITSMSSETANIVKNIMTVTNKFVQKSLTETSNAIQALQYIATKNIHTVNKIIAILMQYGKGSNLEYN